LWPNIFSAISAFFAVKTKFVNIRVNPWFAHPAKKIFRFSKKIFTPYALMTYALITKNNIFVSPYSVPQINLYTEACHGIATRHGVGSSRRRRGDAGTNYEQ
jgi:hypothetical protein